LIWILNILIPLFLFSIILVNCDWNSGIPEYEKLRFKKGNLTLNRPLIHFTPEYGWMNDPNGCWYDKTDNLYHIYFQYNPADTVWGMPLYWGHATSSDLITWKEEKIAIRARDWAGAYSGSMFIDDECVSPWFKDTCPNGGPNYQNVIAAWTWNNISWYEYQCLSYSTNKGFTFVTPENEGDIKNCPAVNESDSTQFRDPQVIKFDSKKYVMSIAKSHEYAIKFYNSSDGVKWDELGAFTLYGYLGFQYECPNLVHLKNNDKETGEKDSYWILFISINPGSQQGGSSTEYFIGTFDYEPSDQKPYKLAENYNYNTLIDVGKDFYAMQIMYFPPDSNEINEGFDTAIGITWASNWQYSKVVPTDPWRSSMAIPRKIKLGHYKPTGTSLIYVLSKALLDSSDNETVSASTESLYDTDLPTNYDYLESGKTYTPPGAANGVLELEITFISCDAYTDHDPGVVTFYLKGGSIPEEYLRFGYNQKADAFFLDRGNTNVQWVHNNPFFTDKLSMNVYGKSNTVSQEGYPKTIFNTETKKYSTENSGKCEEAIFNAHLIIDRNIIEVFFNEDNNGYSAITSTNTFFFTGGNYITTVDIEYNNVVVGDKKFGFREVGIKGRHLNLKTTSTTSTGGTRLLNEKNVDL
jgi:beta-fructofuranosidase